MYNKNKILDALNFSLEVEYRFILENNQEN